ncbi:hypothetical protein L916_03089 [Phytophthora nicotianae]|uniref:Uncharacterized protein n=1 Tax=Phytophthora nicotianae TaxID=4792 RepID=W2JN42_PHYNI|nr:hypothetical protein L916_03089 [Phytophthora nicotianae]
MWPSSARPCSLYPDFFAIEHLAGTRRRQCIRGVTCRRSLDRAAPDQNPFATLASCGLSTHAAGRRLGGEMTEHFARQQILLSLIGCQVGKASTSCKTKTRRCSRSTRSTPRMPLSTWANPAYPWSKSSCCEMKASLLNFTVYACVPGEWRTDGGRHL